MSLGKTFPPPFRTDLLTQSVDFLGIKLLTFHFPDVDATECPQ